MVRWRRFRLCACLISCIFNVFVMGHGFVAGTLINTPNGFMPIEKLKINDLVISLNKTNNTFEANPVKACGRKTIRNLIKVTIGTSPFFTSPEQRFYLATEKKWVFGKDLQPGQLLLQKGGGSAAITGLETIEKETETYELSIEACHNFCASDKSVVAHNVLLELCAIGVVSAESTATVTVLETALVTAVDWTFTVAATNGAATAILGKETMDAFWCATYSAIKNRWNSLWGSETQPNTQPPANREPRSGVYEVFPEFDRLPPHQQYAIREAMGPELTRNTQQVSVQYQLSPICAERLKQLPPGARFSPEYPEYFTKLMQGIDPGPFIPTQPIIEPVIISPKPPEPVVQSPVNNQISTTQAVPASNDIQEKTRPGGSQKKPKTQEPEKAKVCSAGGAPQMPGGPFDPRDPRNNGNNGNLNNPNDKSGPKVKPPEKPKWEKSLSADTFKEAYEMGQKLIKLGGEVDPATAEPTIGKQGICKDRVTGTKWHGNKVSMRLDHDPVKGSHINIKDCRQGKGARQVNASIQFKGDINLVESILSTLEKAEGINKLNEGEVNPSNKSNIIGSAILIGSIAEKADATSKTAKNIIGIADNIGITTIVKNAAPKVTEVAIAIAIPIVKVVAKEVVKATVDLSIKACENSGDPFLFVFAVCGRMAKELLL